MSEKPMGVSIVICEKVITEAGTNNKTLVSTFNTVRSKQFPCSQSLAVYVALTNAMGDKEINLVFAKGETKIAKLGGKVKFLHPNGVNELIFNMINLPLTEPGVYTFEVFADDEYIFESRFNAIKIQEPEKL